MTDKPNIDALGPEFLDMSRILGRVVNAIHEDKIADRWDVEAAVAYIETLTKEELQGALFAAAFMLRAQKYQAAQKAAEG